MPPKKRKAEAEVADDDNGGGSLTPATKKSKKEAALEARARAKAWRDGRRQKVQSGAAPSSSSSTAASKTKSKITSSPKRPTTPEAIAFAEASMFSNGRKPPKMATASTSTSSKRRRTPSKRTASGTPSSTRRKSARKAATSEAAESSSPRQQRSAIIPTTFQFDESAVVGNQPAAVAVASTTARGEGAAENELLPRLGDKKKKQQEGRARIENLRKMRQESGLKVTSPVVAQEENVVEKAAPAETVDDNYGREDTITTTTTTATKTIITTKSLVVTPGKIGLSLNVNLTKGGATVTQVAPTCRYIGQIAVGDVIKTINGKVVKSVSDMHVDSYKDRIFEVVSEREVVEERAVANADPPTIAVMAAPTNNKTAVDPPPSSETVRTGVISHPIIASIISNNGNDNRLNEVARSDASTTTTQTGRNGPTKLQQLRESMRNVPAVKPASTGVDNDDKMPARPSPPGKVISDVASAAATTTTTDVSAPTPNVAEENGDNEEEEKEDGGILKASISRAQQLVSSVAFVNRQRRGRLGIKSDSIENDSILSTTEGEMQQMASPSIDPPSSSVSEAEEKTDDKLVEDTPIEELDVIDEPRASFAKRVIKLICMVLKCVSVIPLAVGAFYVLGSFQGDSSMEQIERTSSMVDAVPLACFATYPSGFHSSEENITEDDGCDGNYIECPQWGRCHGGILIDCQDEDGKWQGLDRFVPNEGGRACVPSDSALMISEVVQNALMNMTVSQSCRSSDMIADPASVLLQEPYPLFSLDVVSWKVNEASEVDITLSAELLLWLQPVFDTGLVSFGHLSEDDSVPNAIGLSSKVPEHRLPVPFSCKTKFIFMELVGLLARLFYHSVVFLLRILWKYIAAYPISSPFVLLFFGSVVIIRSKKKHRAKVREIFDVVKDDAYDRLANCDGSGGYAALHLRDDVGHALYPSNLSERLFMYNHVWPQVIVEIRHDNRVRKFRKSADGKQLEHWDLNTNSKRGWQMRKTPNKTPAKPVGNKSPTKRDP